MERLSFEEYRKKHYQKQFEIAIRILAEVAAVDSDAFKATLPILLGKMWTPEVYLREEYDKSGAPEKAGPVPPENVTPFSSPQRDAQVSFRKPTQTLKQTLRKHMRPELFEKLEIQENRITKNYFLTDNEWEALNGLLKNWGFRWVSAGKDSRWEKQ